jgi:hypothetical protein
MSRLTQTAKTELKQLMQDRLDEMEQAIRAEHEPEIKIIDADARALAVESLGLTELEQRCTDIISQRAALLEELNELHQQQDVLLCKPEERRSPGRYYQSRYDNGGDESSALSYYACELLPKRREHHRTALMAGSDFGQKLNDIKTKSGSVAKDILLATMPEQLTAVYTNFCRDFGLEE